MHRTVLTAVILAALFASPLSRAHAQSIPATDTLCQQIQALDTELFNAYNRCDLTTLSSMVADDLEFYHDKTGLAIGRQVFIDAIKNNLCGKVSRELVPGTLEVYPIAHYGAVEIGVHRFHHPGQPDNIGEAKFVHLWRNQDGKWQVTRVISYDHQPLTK